MKCHIVKDLLPNYVDDLLSIQTRQDVEAHLEQCEACQHLLNQLQAPLANPHEIDALPAERQQLDFLKKVRQHAFRSIIGVLTVAILAFTALTFVLSAGSTVDSADLTIESELDGQMWQIHLTKRGYRELLVRTTPIYSEPDAQGLRNVIGTIIEPFSVLPATPWGKNRKAFDYSSELSDFDNPDFHIILRLDDKDVIYRAGQLEGKEQDRVASPSRFEQSR